MKYLLALILILLLAGCTTEPQPIEKTDLKLKCLDYFTGEPCTTDFSVEDRNGTVYLTGTLEEDVWNVFNKSLEKQKEYFIWGGFDDTHYPKKLGVVPLDEYILEYKAIKHADNITVSHTGEIEDGEINLTIEANNGAFTYMDICLGFSFGILDVDLPQYAKECNTQWLNYSNYNIETEEYTYYPQGTYSCGEEQVKCSKIEGNLCYVQSMPIPERYSHNADKCYSLAKTLHPNEPKFSTILKVYSLDNIYSDDYITIYIIDNQQVKANNIYEYQHSKGRTDIGIEDVEYTILNS